jgi:ubiquitin-conjugating enzyme E2 W
VTQAKQQLPPGIELVKADDFQEWQMDIRVMDANPLYLNQVFRLCFRFGPNYPIGRFPIILLHPSLDHQARVREESKIMTNKMLPVTEAPEVIFLNVPASANSAPTSRSNPVDLTSSTPTPSLASARPIPIHPHIYSNGIICLDLLGTAGWSPVQSVESVCMSIQSMLTGNTKNERPQGDAEFVRSMGGAGGFGGRRLRDVRFVYDDNTV